MRKNYFYLLLLMFLNIGAFNSFAQGNRQTVNIDFGRPGFITTETGWNNLYNEQSGFINNLTNSTGAYTGIEIAVTDPFNSINRISDLEADASLNIPVSAASDSFWGSVALVEGKQEPTGGVTLSNLHVGTAYSFEFFASRGTIGNTRMAKYIVEGATTQEVSLNASNNTSNTAVVANIMPKEDGTITVTATAGVSPDDANGTYFLGVIRITYDKSPDNKYVNLSYPNGAQVLKSGRQVDIEWDSENVNTVKIDYTPDGGGEWVSIATAVPAANKKFSWTVPATLSDFVTVRITDSENEMFSDISMAPFAIIEDDGENLVCVDFGVDWVSATKMSPMPWNNVLDHVAGSVESLINEQGESTGISLAITERFNSFNRDAGLDADEPLKIPFEASDDFFFGGTAVNGGITAPQSTLTISKLKAENTYSFTFYASRAGAGGNRDTKYTVEGMTTGEATLDPIDNRSRVAIVSNIKPKADGTILVRITEGTNNTSGFFYLNAMKMSYGYTNPLGIAEEEFAAKVSIYPNPTSGNVFIDTKGEYKINRIQVLSLSGQKVMDKEVQNTSADKVDVSGLAKGLYILQVYTNKGRFHSRVVVR